jgi:hypothetical protein
MSEDIPVSIVESLILRSMFLAHVLVIRTVLLLNIVWELDITSISVCNSMYYHNAIFTFVKS